MHTKMLTAVQNQKSKSLESRRNSRRSDMDKEKILKRFKYFVLVVMHVSVLIYTLLGDKWAVINHMNVETLFANATNKEAATPQRRHLLLHVGPEKTGSTYIQSSAEKLTDLFERDNYQYFGAHTGPSSMQRIYDVKCHRNVVFAKDFPNDCPESQEFGNLLKKHHEESRNLFISQEHLWRRVANAVEGGELYKAIHSAFEDWETTVVFVYRRIFELVPSQYSERNRRDAFSNLWPDKGGVVIPGIVDFYYRDQPEGMAKHAYIAETMAKTKFAERFQRNFTVLNFHQEGDIMENLICSHMQSDANHTCAFLKSRRRAAATVQHGVGRASYEFGYDRLAVEAYQRGYLKNKKLSRRGATWRIKSQVERMDNFTLQDFPQACLDSDSLQDILFWSKKFDQDMLGESSVIDGAKGERQFELDFESKVAKKKFCSTDVEKVLAGQDSRWQTILRGLLK